MAYITALETAVQMLSSQVAVLQARVGQNSTNSSRPPSSDPPRAPTAKPPRGGRRPGGQAGHRGHQRQRVPADQVTRTVAYVPATCGRCGHDLAVTAGPADPPDWCHQVAELLPVTVEVTAHHLAARTCAGCGHTTRAAWPAGVPHGLVGPRLAVTIALLTGRYRLSKREAAAVLADLFGVSLAVGTISAVEQQVSAALAPVVTEARTAVRSAPVVNLDETGWREGRRRAWLWTAVTALVTVFHIDRSRGSGVVRMLLGPDWQGVVGSDRFSAYRWLEAEWRQVCWAHLRRDFQKLVDWGPGPRPVGQRLVACHDQVFALWGRHQTGELDRACAGGARQQPGSGSSAASSGSGQAAVAAGGVAKTAELLPPGLEQAYPEIARYHWSKLTISKNQPKRGGRMKMELFFDTPTWDPYDPSVTLLNVPMTFFYNRLLKPDLTLESALAGKNNMFDLVLNGDLSKSWEQPDKTTYTFKLHENIKFHDIAPVNGRPLTAEDFVYSYRQYLETKAVGQAAIFRDVDKFEAVDKTTFKITTKKPVAYLLNSLSAPLAFVIAKEARERADGLKPDPPIGTGPFIMKEHKFRNTLTMDRNPAYFREGRPYLDGIDLVWIGDPATAMAAYRTGQIHTTNFIRAGERTAFEDLLKTEGWSRDGGKTDVHVNQMNSGGAPYFAFRLDQAPFNDVRVRRALSMALDREKMILSAYGWGRYALGFPTDWVYPAGRPWPHEPKDFPEWFRVNPEKAKALLAEAGVQPGQLKIDVLVSSTTGTAVGPVADQATLAQEAWKRIGVEAQIKVTDAVAFQTNFYSKKGEPNQVFAAPPISSGLDLDDYSYRVLRGGELANYINLADAEMDRLLEAQQAEFDRGKREEIGRRIAERDMDQVIRVWGASRLWWEMKRPFVQNWITHDVYMSANGWGSDQTENTWLDQ
ncbi:MAG: IS66 family transposase [Dehalococcoidia bacterium]